MHNKQKDSDLQEVGQEKKVVMTETELHELLDVLQEEIHADIQKTILRSEQFSGPVPHPNHMKQYKIIDKSLPHRFTKMAEDNLSHR